VYLVDEQIRTLPQSLRDWLVCHQITVSFLPTPLAEQLLDFDWPPGTMLRFLLTGADVLHGYPRETLPFALINNYGPTEATVVATSGRIWPQAEAEMPPSIGCPIANTEVYLLDEYLQQVAIGEPGELHIGGIGLARGYLHRPELTQEKFISHPFSRDPGARLYKTGDLARFLPDGRLAFLGRIDHQIKLRGYRIEPNEIVGTLNRHPAVQASYVLAREDAQGGKQLVAYLVVQPGCLVELADLVQTLQATLPEYMVPTTFVQMAALPLTPNGKVDRDALPAPTQTNTLGVETLAPPFTPIEDQLATTVAMLLRVDRVGVTENFFLLGGHSMLGAQLIAWIGATFSLELPLRTLFDAPTVRQLAAEVERRLMAKLEAMSEDEACRLLER
jgi:acyl-CoA synthetase (AMP-forming)/AMP-acid ligase II